MPDDFGHLEEEVMERMEELRRERLGMSPGNRAIDTIFKVLDEERLEKEGPVALETVEPAYDPIDYRDATTPKPTKPLSRWASFWKWVLRR